MNVYTYSEARQNLSEILKKAKSSGKVIIKRKDGSAFAIVPEKNKKSPFDVPNLKTNISLNDIIDSVRESRERI